MAASDIEWTEATWNPLAGCAVLSSGCTLASSGINTLTA
jgi:protein gp37